MRCLFLSFLFFARFSSMDSLLANYASSDEEGDAQPQLQRSDSLDKQFSSASSILSSLPRPKSSSIISLPPPKFGNGDQQQNPSRPGSTDLFSLLSKPKSQTHHDYVVDTGSEAYPKPKRFVQLKLPIMYRPPTENAEDDEEEQKTLEERRRKLESSSAEAPSVKSFLSSIPAPKNAKAALGALPSSVSGRRSITIETQVETPTVNNLEMHDYNVATSSSGNHDEDSVSASDSYPVMGTDADVNYDQGRYEGYVGHGGGYESYGAHEGNWVGGSIETGLQKPMISESAVRRLGKRKKNEMPMEIVEVKQDELMKNRPREDQSKLTGIAFGPSYQPISSSKGKPSKLHKRKHQIGTLYYDMKQKEMELSERRSKGFLTKAETHAKYGW